MELKNLYDLPLFTNLRKIGDKYSLGFTLSGSSIRYFCLYQLQQKISPLSVVDIFQMVPFTSDIDLVHSGSSDLTSQIFNTLFQEVPFAEYFRWQIRSEMDNRIYADAMKCNGIIPTNLMTLSSNSREGIIDPWKGREDIANKKYRYIRNGFYQSSPLYQQGLDLEMFSALLYFRVLADAGIPIGQFESQPGFSAAKKVILDSTYSPHVRIRLQESSYLRTRLHYILKGLRPVIPDEEVEQFIDQIGLKNLLDYLDEAEETSHLSEWITSWFDNEGKSLTVSANLGGDTFRIGHTDSGYLIGQEAEGKLMGHLAKLEANSNSDQFARTFKLGEGQKILFGSGVFQIKNGVSISSRGNEFIHLAFHPVVFREFIPDIYKLDKLATILVIWSKDQSFKPLLWSVPSVFSFASTQSSSSKLLVRINAFGLLEMAKLLFNEENSNFIQVFIIGRNLFPIRTVSMKRTKESK